jgi:hypothetical protein
MHRSKIMALIYTHTKRVKNKKITRQQEKDLEDFEKLKAKWAEAPKFCSKANIPRVPKTQETPNPLLAAPKLKPGKLDAGSTAKKDVAKYTGSKMLGIGQLHKSNGVPVFSQEEAIDIAKMRRG